MGILIIIFFSVVIYALCYPEKFDDGLGDSDNSVQQYNKKRIL